MKVEDDFKRIFWRFSKGNFTPNQADVDAITRIAEWFNKSQEETIRTHQLFAKMYVKRLTENFGAFRDLKFCLENMDFECKLPLSHYYDEFRFVYNAIKYKMFLESKGQEWVEEPYKTEEDKQLITEHIINDQEFQKYLFGYWPAEKIETSLNNQLTEVINKYKNHI